MKQLAPKSKQNFTDSLCNTWQVYHATAHPGLKWDQAIISIQWFVSSRRHLYAIEKHSLNDWKMKQMELGKTQKAKFDSTERSNFSPLERKHLFNDKIKDLRAESSFTVITEKMSRDNK